MREAFGGGLQKEEVMGNVSEGWGDERGRWRKREREREEKEWHRAGRALEGGEGVMDEEWWEGRKERKEDRVRGKEGNEKKRKTTAQNPRLPSKLRKKETHLVWRWGLGGRGGGRCVGCLIAFPRCYIALLSMSAMSGNFLFFCFFFFLFLPVLFFFDKSQGKKLFYCYYFWHWRLSLCSS